MKKIIFLLILTSGIFQVISCQTNETQTDQNQSNKSQTNKSQTNIEGQSDKDKFITTVQFLEENPLAETAKEKRSWALKYAQDVKYPTCDKLLKLFLGKEVRGEVLSQFLIKLAAYELENSEKKYDIIDSQVAGLESSIKVYEKIIKTDPSAKYGYLDALLAIRSKNEYEEFVKDNNCK